MNDRTTVATPNGDASADVDGNDAAPVREADTDTVATESDSGRAQDSPDAEATADDPAATKKRSTATKKKRDAEKEPKPASTSSDSEESATGEESEGEKPPSVDADSAGGGESETAEPPEVAGDAEGAAAEGDSGEDAATSAGNATPAAESRWRRLIPRPVTGVLLLLLVVAVVCAAVFGWKLNSRNDNEAAGRAAMAAAKDYAVALTSIDYRHLEPDISTVLNGATGQFKNEYSQSANQLKPLLQQAKSVSKGHVVAASVQSASPDHAVVMLFVDAQITNVTNPQPRVDRNRILMDMDRVGGHWLAAKVDLP